MKPATLRQRWIKALRSGKYTQTRRTLKDQDGFCCLGVLCDVLDPKGWNGKMYRFGDQARGRGAFPPVAVTNAVGLGRGEVRRLAQWNDVENLSFAQIADLLEKEELV